MLSAGFLQTESVHLFLGTAVDFCSCNAPEHSFKVSDSVLRDATTVKW